MKKTSWFAYFFGHNDAPIFDWDVEFKWRHCDAIYDIKDPITHGTWTIDSKNKTIAYRVESFEERRKRFEDCDNKIKWIMEEDDRRKELAINRHKLILSIYERAIEEKKQKAKLRIEIKEIVIDTIRDMHDKKDI